MVNASPPPVTASGPATATEATPGASRRTNSKLEKALEDLKQNLTKDQRASFQACGREDVEAAIRSIQERLGAKRRLPNLQRLSKFVDLLGQLAIAGGDFVSVNGPSNFLWAPLRHALEQASRATGTQGHCLDKLVDILGQIGDIFPQLNEYHKLFVSHPDVILIVDHYQEVILKFHTGLMEVFNRSAWRSVFDSSWRRFSKMADEIKETLLRIRKLLDEAKATASVREIQALRYQLTQESQVAACREDEASKERRRVHLQEIVNKLAAPQYLDDQEDLQRRTHESARGDWLFRHEAFIRWVDVDDETHRVLDLNGCPGAGKTFLVSNVIRHLQELKGKPTEGIPLAYFFFKNDTQSKVGTTCTAALRALIEQLVKGDSSQTLLDHAFQILSTVNTPSKNQLAELASTALRSRRFCFLILDGLDECETADREMLLDWLRKLTCTPGESPFTLRILLSGRREDYLERTIATLPQTSSVRVDAVDGHAICIRLYTEEQAEAIRTSFKASHDTREIILDKITSRAEGMFLFAHVVLQYLIALPTLEDLLEELQDEVFPSQLGDAYDRIAVQVLDRHPNPSLPARPKESRKLVMAKQLLSWVSCASRPLAWREIQARFMISTQAGPERDAYTRMAKFTPKQLCGCFVDISGTGSESERTVHIVHRTASEYLQYTNRIPSATEQHMEMLSFCCQYLNSDPFIKPTSTELRHEHAEAGYYAFQDYAAAHWWDHAKSLESSQQLQQHQEQPQIVADLTDLLANYGRGAKCSTNSRVRNLGDILADLHPLASERNKDLLFEHRISLIREAVVSVQESAAKSQDREFSVRMDGIYGPLRHKCPKPWCSEFHLGFESQTRLQAHNDAHERPFRCPVEGCAVAAVGFVSESALKTHHKRYHHVEKEPVFETADNRTWRKLLSRAIKAGSLERVKEIISPPGSDEVLRERARGSLQEYAHTPLLEAIRSRQPHICEYLLEAGADVNRASGKTHVTPLREAIATNDQEIFNLLLRQDGVDPLEEPSLWPPEQRVKHFLPPGKNDTLDFALAFSSVEFILPILSKADLPTSRLFSYLQTLTESRAPGRNEVLRVLATSKLGFRSDKCDEETGGSLLSFAVRNNSAKMVASILATSSNDINSKDKFGKTPVFLAVQNSNEAVLKLLLETGRANVNSKENNGFTPLLWAAGFGNEAVVKLLVESGCADVNSKDTDGCTPLIRAAKRGDEAIVKLLLDTGYADINSRDKDGWTALSWAAYGQDEAVVKLLLGAGCANVNSKDDDGWTPLSWAAQKGNEPIVKLLVETGRADVHSSDRDGRTPLSWAILGKNEAVIKLLDKAAGVDNETKEENG
ncbi:hypothetical protein RB598_004370 [Gaeumannomyces tritici]